jgi:sterol desaturase/sphingolipid hydroxylase (fatty acid hydroxylase superfamily)
MDQDLPVLGLYALAYAASALLVALEFGYGRLRGLQLYDEREAATTVYLYLGFFVLMTPWTLVVFLAYSWAYSHRIADLQPAGVWAWAALFLCDDFCFYWYHRVSHKLQPLWAAHQAHHSSTRFNFLAAYRQGWLPFFALPFWMPLPWLGFHPAQLMFMTVVNLFLQVWLHTRLVPRLGPLEWVLNTPSHHRVHHAAHAPYLNRNFGGLLIVWDRLFGSFQQELSEPAIRYGLKDQAPEHSAAALAFGPFTDWLRGLLRRPRSA